MTAADPGRYIGVIPSHPLVCIVFIWSDKLWPRMTKAADPMLWVRGLWGSWPVWLDRIPRRMRTQCTTTCGSDTGRVRVLLAGGLRPGRLLLASLVGGVAEDHGSRAGPRIRVREDRFGNRRGDRRIRATHARKGRAAANEQGAHAERHTRRRCGIGRCGKTQHP